MIIKRVTLQNWCQHKNLVADLGANVVGVIGPNGRGKSNFLRAIEYGLTGNKPKKNLTSCIYCYGAPDGAKSATVTIEFEQRGLQGKITRTISGSTTKRLLEIGDEKLTSDAEVAARMEELMGADKAAMVNAVFIKQSDIAKIVKGTPADRNDIFMKLMNLNFMNARVDDLTAKISKLQAGVIDLTPVLDSQLVREVELQERVLVTSQQLAALANCKSELDRVDSLYQQLSRRSDTGARIDRTQGDLILKQEALVKLLAVYGYSSMEELSEACTIATQANDAAIAVLNAARLEYSVQKQRVHLQESSADAARHITTLTAQLENLRDPASCQIEIASLNSKMESTAFLNKLNSHLVITQEKVTTLREDCNHFLQHEASLIPIKQQEIQTKQEALTALRPQYEKALLRFNVFSVTGAVLNTCPVCDQLCETVSPEKIVAYDEEAQSIGRCIRAEELAVEQLTRQLTELTAQLLEKTQATIREEEALKELEVGIADLSAIVGPDSTVFALQGQIAALQVEVSNHAQYTTQIAAHTATMASNTIALAALPPATVAVSDSDITALEVASHEAFDHSQVVMTVYGTTRDNTSALAHMQTSKLAAEAEYLELSDAITATNLDGISIENRFDIAEVIILRDALRERAAEFLAATLKLSTDQQDLNTIQEQVTATRKRIATNSDRLTMIKNLENIKGLISRGGIPMDYMMYVFSNMSDVVQDMLEQMGANFTVLIDEERPLTFKFVRLDDATGYEMGQEELSGGQAIRLSIALLIACQRIILPHTGLLILDEPSSHVDEEGVESLKELFLTLTAVFGSSESQLIVVDHNKALNAAFEEFVEL